MAATRRRAPPKTLAALTSAALALPGMTSHSHAAAARGELVEVDAETAAMLDYTQTCYDRSDGLFDITAGVLRQVWSFGSGRLPDPRDIATMLRRVGWGKLRWQKPRLEFTVAGMELDFGGIVKEYAADRASTLLLDLGVAHGLVNLGGDIRVLGPHPDGRGWAPSVSATPAAPTP